MSVLQGWTPRTYQRPAWLARQTGCKRFLLVWHRRAGKDDFALRLTAAEAMQRPANYWHCLPMYEQARKAIWEAINPHTGRRRIDEAFPPAMRTRTDNSSMTLELVSGSIWRVVGSDNPDTLVGAPPVGIVFSEWAISNPSAWAYLAPILAENDGWAVFITTPRGRNHVKSMLDMARRNPGTWYSEVLTPAETGFPQDLIEEQRSEYRSIFGLDAGDALIDQEYWCSFESAILGAYYGRELLEAERAGRIGLVAIDPALPVCTAWDIGVNDQTSIWCFQQAPGQVRLVDYYEASGYAVDHYVEWLVHRGYRGTDYLPHDARVREWTSAGPDGKAKSRIQRLLELERRPKVVRQQKLLDGVSAARRLLQACLFDAEHCERGLECLRQYRREWDDRLKVFEDRPLHDWASHGADAFRTLALGVGVIHPPRAVETFAPRTLDTVTFDEMLQRQRQLDEARL
jgi:hypothetical protein